MRETHMCVQARRPASIVRRCIKSLIWLRLPALAAATSQCTQYMVRLGTYAKKSVMIHPLEFCWKFFRNLKIRVLKH